MTNLNNPEGLDAQFLTWIPSSAADKKRTNQFASTLLSGALHSATCGGFQRQVQHPSNVHCEISWCGSLTGTSKEMFRECSADLTLGDLMPAATTERVFEKECMFEGDRRHLSFLLLALIASFPPSALFSPLIHLQTYGLNTSHLFSPVLPSFSLPLAHC